MCRESETNRYSLKKWMRSPFQQNIFKVFDEEAKKGISLLVRRRQWALDQRLRRGRWESLYKKKGTNRRRWTILLRIRRHRTAYCEERQYVAGLNWKKVCEVIGPQAM